MPAAEPVHDRVALPDPPGMFGGDRVHDRLVEFVVTARVTFPANPFNGATVIEEVPAKPILTTSAVGLTDIVKSCA